MVGQRPCAPMSLVFIKVLTVSLHLGPIHALWQTHCPITQVPLPLQAPGQESAGWTHQLAETLVPDMAVGAGSERG